MTFGFNAFSIIDYSAGESMLINNASTPSKVNVKSGSVVAAIIPVGVGVRGDADGNGAVDLYDVIKIAKYLIKTTEAGYEDTLGFAMADVDLSKKVDLYDAINVAKYMMLREGTEEQKWVKLTGS